MEDIEHGGRGARGAAQGDDLCRRQRQLHRERDAHDPDRTSRTTTSSFIEEPCDFTDPRGRRRWRRFLPVALLGDQCCELLDAVNALIRRELRRRGEREAAPHRHHRIAQDHRAVRGGRHSGRDRHRFREPHRRAGAHAPARGDPEPRAVADRDAFLRQARRRRLRRRVQLRRTAASRRPTRPASARARPQDRTSRSESHAEFVTASATFMPSELGRQRDRRHDAYR